MDNNEKKICFICSSGGHLTELLPVGKHIGFSRNHFWITFKNNMTENTLKGEKFYLIDDPKRNPFTLIKTFFQSLRIYSKERPDIVVTTGAGVVVPFAIIAKLLGKKLVFIESFCRTESKSLSGRILYRFSDRFYVQWKHGLSFGKKAQFHGSVY